MKKSDDLFKVTPVVHNVRMNHQRIAVWIISILALIGMIDASYLILQYIAAVATRGELTPCSPNTLINCTKTVQGSWSHVLFGMPNPLFGTLWYTGSFTYGVARLLGTKFTPTARLFVVIVMGLGVTFSYTLYLSSIFILRGVCPFCLLSTVSSTIIVLSFIVDDHLCRENLLPHWFMNVVRVFQIFSILAFVIGLPLFVGLSLRLLIEPMEAVRHWSFPVMGVLVLALLGAHVWAWRQTAR